MPRFMILIILVFAILSLLFVGCGDDDDDDSGAGPVDDDDDDDTTDDDDDDDTTDDDDDDDMVQLWEPSTVVPIENHPPIRGQEVIRGTIHLHSIYSHDACDGFPWIGGEPNWHCYDQLREAFCSTNQQFVMLTDHKDNFSYHEFPDVLLYQPTEGDELIYLGDDPIANHIFCEDGNDLILMVGNENAIMPIGINRMPDGTGAERETYFGRSDAAVVQSMRDDLGALVFVNHSEQWETDDLLALPIDGIEIFNLHANILPDSFGVIEIIDMVLNILHFLIPLDLSGHSDLIFLTFLAENDISVDHWDKMLDQRPTVGIYGTDAHRNSLPFPLLDGDRADSYRRMMRWMSNYILVEEKSVESIKEAIGAGRLYGAFQVFGEPIGFDFYATSQKEIFQMGDHVQYASGMTLKVIRPELWGMNWDELDKPELTLRIIRADATGGTVVAESTGKELEYTVTEAGAYRAEVRITPYHLVGWLGDSWERYVKEFPLIYGNAIYIED